MALLFMEGFDQYTNPQEMHYTQYQAQSNMPCRWYTYGWGLNASVIDSATYRTAQPGGVSKALYLHPTQSGYTAFQTLSIPNLTNVFFGFAARVSACGGNLCVLTTQVSYTNTSYTNIGLYVYVAGDGSLKIYNAQNGATLLSSVVNTIVANTWHYIEVNAVYSNAGAGSLTLRVDGDQVATVSGITTSCGVPVTGWPYINFGNVHTIGHHFDDIYVCDNTTAVNNTFLGAINVYTLYPNGAGTSTQMTPTGAANNWDCVNDTAPDTTTYVSASAANLTDLYAIQSMTASPPNIFAVAVSNYSMKTDNGPRQVKNTLYNAGGTAYGTATTPINNLYRWSQDIYITQPDGSAWTLAALGGIQIGIKSE